MWAQWAPCGSGGVGDKPRGGMQSAPQWMVDAMRDWQSERGGWSMERWKDFPIKVAGEAKMSHPTLFHTVSGPHTS